MKRVQFFLQMDFYQSIYPYIFIIDFNETHTHTH